MSSRALAGWRLQLTVVVLASALWALYPHASLGALLTAYTAAWVALNIARWLYPRLFRASLTRAQALILTLALISGPIARAVELRDDFLVHEGIESAEHLVAARLRLERTPSIAPPLVSDDRPQSFFVYAPNARHVVLHLGAGGPQLESQALGHGLFRLTYDPRRDGELPMADGPFEAVILADGERYGRTMEVAHPLPHPRWIAAAPDRTAVATVSEETDELILISATGTTLRVPVEDGPTDVAFMGSRRVIVSHRYSEALLVLDAASGEVTDRIELGFFQRRVAVAASGRIAVARGGSRPSVTVLDEGTRASNAPLQMHRIDLPSSADWLAFGPDEDWIVLASRRPPALHRFRRTGHAWVEDAAPLQLGRPAVTLARTGSGEQVVVAVTDYRPGGPPHLGNHFVQDQLLWIDVRRWRVVEQQLTPIRTSRQRSPGDVDRGVSPMGIDIQDDGTMFVAFAGTDDVWRFSADAAQPERFALDAPLVAPFSAVALHNGRFVVSSPAYGAIGIYSPSGQRATTVRLAPGDQDLLRHRQERVLQRRIGERTFYESTRAGISCQSCHLHGESDGTEHNIGGATFVSTLDVRGLLGTPPYLRDGGYALLGDLDDVSQTLYRGYLRHQGGRKVGLQRYLESLPRAISPRQLEGGDFEREQRGLDVYVRARCPMCHSFPAFTNLGQHPAEVLFPGSAAGPTGSALDTPSLLALATSAPYLLDGRAETLESVFRDHDPARRHGDTADLTDEELRDLVYFLEGL